MAVKTKAKSSAITFTSFWLIYFLFSIAVIGAVGSYLVFVPISVLAEICGTFSKPLQMRLRRRADLSLRAGIMLLMKVQPWFAPQMTIPIVRRPTGAPGQLFVSNHRSHIEAFVLLSHIAGIRILAKQALFYIPFLGLMMRFTRQIAVPQGSITSFLDAMEQVRVRLRQGELVHVFPEMTRAELDRPGTRNFSAAPFRAAILEGVEIRPLVFIHSDRVWPKGRAAISFRYPMQARELATIDAKKFSSADELRDEVRRRIDEALA